MREMFESGVCKVWEKINDLKGEDFKDKVNFETNFLRTKTSNIRNNLFSLQEHEHSV
jgi:hypothetical protein